MHGKAVIEEVSTRRQLRAFIGLPARIHQRHAGWVPPLRADEWRFFDPRKNRAFSYSDTCLLLAHRDGAPVGRIMGIINHRYNDHRGEEHGRFAYLECDDDQEVAHALLGAVEGWGRRRRMHKLIGPMGFSDQDPEGYQIEGFEHAPTMENYYNFPFMIGLLEAEGYAKEVDYVVYRVDIPDPIPEFYQRIFRRAQGRSGATLVEFSARRQLTRFVRPILEVMNEAFRHLYGFMPLDTQEMVALARRFSPVLDPRFVKVAVSGNEVVGFIIGIPNMCWGLQRAKGRLFPLGWVLILRAAKTTRQLDLLVGGVRDRFRGRGVEVMLGLKTLEEARRAGFEFLDSHHELETNTKIRAEMERLGGQVYKRFRVFQKSLG